MEGLKTIPAVVIGLVIAGIIAAASLVTTGAFQDTVNQCYNSTYVYNSSLDVCHAPNPGMSPWNETHGFDGENLSNEYWGIKQANEGQLSVSNQLTTVAVVAVMVIIIGLLASLFVYFRYFR